MKSNNQQKIEILLRINLSTNNKRRMEMIKSAVAAFTKGQESWNAQIDSICDVKCFAYVEKTTCDGKDWYLLRINADIDSYHYNEEKWGEHHLFNKGFPTLPEALAQLNYIFDSGYITIRNELETATPEMTLALQAEQKAYYERYKDSKKVKLRFDECSVCYELTTSGTDCCKKKLCLKCLQKIVMEAEATAEEEDDYDVNEPVEINCPCCREFFNWCPH